eukprot:2339896-Pleurochrysis_carterae.AAC.2
MSPPSKRATLWIHSADFSEEEVVLSPALLEELRVKKGELIQITSARSPGASPSASIMSGSCGRVETGSVACDDVLVLRVGEAEPTRSQLQISILKHVAETFRLSNRETVEVRPVASHGADVTLDWVELVFKDQYLSRGDIWYCRQQLVKEEPALYHGKTFVQGGARLSVHAMSRRGGAVSSGVLGPGTRVSFRSRSAAFFLLMQMSPEMWEMAPDGELHYEKVPSAKPPRLPRAPPPLLPT